MGLRQRSPSSSTFVVSYPERHCADPGYGDPGSGSCAFGPGFESDCDYASGAGFPCPVLDKCDKR